MIFIIPLLRHFLTSASQFVLLNGAQVWDDIFSKEMYHKRLAQAMMGFCRRHQYYYTSAREVVAHEEPGHLLNKSQISWWNESKSGWTAKIINNVGSGWRAIRITPMVFVNDFMQSSLRRKLPKRCWVSVSDVVVLRIMFEFFYMQLRGR